MEDGGFTRALRAVHDDGAGHFGARVLQRVGHPPHDPGEYFLAILFFAAQVFDGFQQHVAAPLLWLDRPSLPGVEQAVLVAPGRVEPDLIKIVRAPLHPHRVALDVVPAHPGGQHGEHGVLERELVRPGVEQRLAGAVVDRDEAIDGVVHQHDGLRALALIPSPLWIFSRDYWCALVPFQLVELCVDLVRQRQGNPCHHGEVVVVGELLPVARICAVVGEKVRLRPGAKIDCGGGLRGGGAAGVAFGQVVVIGADEDAQRGVGFAQRLGGLDQVVGAECVCNGLAGGVCQAGAGGESLAKQQDAVALDVTDQAEGAGHGHATRPELFVAPGLDAARVFLWQDELQAAHFGVRVVHGDDQRAFRAADAVFVRLIQPGQRHAFQ